MRDKKKLPIGVSDYRKIIVEDYYYADKTLFIKEVIDSAAEIILIPRPRRFGKTLNLSMLRYFYEKTTADTSYLFKNLAIWQEEEYKEKQDKYPVIYITFKDVKELDWESCCEKMQLVIKEQYKEHSYLLTSADLTKDEINTHIFHLKKTS